MAFTKLFSPIRIRGLELKNRVVMTGMATHMIENDYFVSDQLINYHTARAKGGVGLNTIEVCSVDTLSAQRNMLSISEDCFIEGHKRLTDSIHLAGGKACVQLWQGGTAVMTDPQAEVLVPSEITFTPEFSIPAITIEQMERIRIAYGKAAARAVEAGYDAVEFHAAHNYLPHAFLSGGFNYRTDEYGGSLENRMRYPLQLIESIRSNIPDTMPLFMRIDAFDDDLPNGLTIEEVIAFCKRAGETGVDVLNVSRGNFSSDNALIYEVPPCDLPNGFNVDNASRIRKETGMITMPTGRINTPQLAESILEADKADLIVMARAQLADPEFCNKAKNGEISSIKYCIGCNQGCYDYFTDKTKEHITCLRNPAVGHEKEYEVKKAEICKTVLIAGGGIAGLEAADILYKRGHKPIICEESDHLGGQLLLAGAAPRKEDVTMAVQMAVQNIIDKGIEYRLNTPVTPTLIEERQANAVIVAIGAKPLIPDIPGMNEPYVVNSHDILAGKTSVKGNIVVIGGGLVGLEVAEYVKHKLADNVTVLEMRENVGIDLGEMRRIMVNKSIADSGIKTITNTKCLAIRNNTVFAESNHETIEIPADYVIIAVGARSRSSEEIINCCKNNGIPTYVVGDALRARRALNAIHEAFHAAFEV